MIQVLFQVFLFRDLGSWPVMAFIVVRKGLDKLLHYEPPHLFQYSTCFPTFLMLLIRQSAGNILESLLN